MKQTTRRFQQMYEKLKKFHYKLTPQRIAILKILSERFDHPRPEDIYDDLQQQLPTTSPATVYKTLTVLKKLKEVLEIQYSHESNRYDAVNPFPHPHIFCTACQKITDLDFSEYDILQKKIALQTGYHVETVCLEVAGVCPDCQKISESFPGSR
ncbi:MAG: transcriptional repressor [Candidatus Magnetomorum sp.]|nr:transcriptional repressor [Candidatus Magnetomorum sp.]